MRKKIPIVFNKWSNCDYHFIIKELAEAFKKQFTCLGQNTEKYITLTVSVEKEVTRKVKLDLLTDIDLILMVEKGIGGGICHSIYIYANANKKHMKGYDKNKESSYFQ